MTKLNSGLILFLLVLSVLTLLVLVPFSVYHVIKKFNFDVQGEVNNCIVLYPDMFSENSSENNRLLSECITSYSAYFYRSPLFRD